MPKLLRVLLRLLAAAALLTGQWLRPRAQSRLALNVDFSPSAACRCSMG